MRTLSPPFLWLLWVALALPMAVGVLGRGYWTPDEPREADIAWRMSWQADKAVPELAGEAFCEKPPLTYWVAGAAIGTFGVDSWAARLPNLLYALVTALAVGSLGRRSTGALAGAVAAAAISTLLLSYQVAIWLATDAPLLAAVAVALLGLYRGFYAEHSRERLRGYTYMHAALALGFLSKSAAGWMTPALAFLTLVAWERRWRELLRWELYVGFILQAAIILTWVGFVYWGPDGPAHLKVFFWNNLAGRFAKIEAPEAVQYAAAHRNTPGKYLIELPIYLWPWTLLCVAAVRRAWQRRALPAELRRPVRFAVATFVPTLAVLSIAATARNIYLAPALPGAALLLGWWVNDLINGPVTDGNLARAHHRWDERALCGTALLLVGATAVLAAAVVIVGLDSWSVMPLRAVFLAVSAAGLAAGAACSTWSLLAARRGLMLQAVVGLLLAYCALLVGPASQIYRRVDAWQDLASIGRDIRHDSAGREMILFVPDETTRAFIDMYTQTSVVLIPAPMTAQSTKNLKNALADHPRSVVVAQLPGRSESPALSSLKARFHGARSSVAELPIDDVPPSWAAESHLRSTHRYSLPNGRRYALFEPDIASR
jgi:4-amino-4-deoxy-L-arabinose transferase-like glycosyltransferase